MDSKSFRLSILALVTTVVLVGVVVYAANRDKIHALMGANSTYEESSDAMEGEEAEVTESTEYGEQIGDNLKGFLTADDFFDKSEQRPSVVVVVDNVPVPANAENSGVEDTTDLLDVPQAEKSEPDKPEGEQAEVKPDEEKSEEDKPDLEDSSNESSSEGDSEDTTAVDSSSAESSSAETSDTN